MRLKGSVFVPSFNTYLYFILRLPKASGASVRSNRPRQRQGVKLVSILSMRDIMSRRRRKTRTQYISMDRKRITSKQGKLQMIVTNVYAKTIGPYFIPIPIVIWFRLEFYKVRLAAQQKDETIPL